MRRVSVVTTLGFEKQRTVKLSGVTSEDVHQRSLVNLDFFKLWRLCLLDDTIDISECVQMTG